MHWIPAVHSWKHTHKSSCSFSSSCGSDLSSSICNLYSNIMIKTYMQTCISVSFLTKICISKSCVLPTLLLGTKKLLVHNRIRFRAEDHALTCRHLTLSSGRNPHCVLILNFGFILNVFEYQIWSWRYWNVLITLNILCFLIKCEVSEEARSRVQHSLTCF